MEGNTAPLDEEHLRDMRARILEFEARLASLQNIMNAIEDDSFGRCEICKDDIEARSLESDPLKSYCNLHEPEPRLI